MNKPERLPSADLAQWLPTSLAGIADDQKAIPRIAVVLGEGTQSVKRDLALARNGFAYAGSPMGREIVYGRGRIQGHTGLGCDKLAMNKAGRC